MALLNNVPAPLSDPISKPRREQYTRDQRDPQEGLVSQPWVDFFSHNSDLLEKFPARVHWVQLTEQSASISATDMTEGTLSDGVYRVTYYARITQAAGVDSSLTVAIDFQDGGVTCSFTGAAITGNTTATVESESWTFQLDSLTPVRYSTTYVSNAGLGSDMIYRLTLVLEEVLA